MILLDYINNLKTIIIHLFVHWKGSQEILLYSHIKWGIVNKHRYIDIYCVTDTTQRGRYIWRFVPHLDVFTSAVCIVYPYLNFRSQFTAKTYSLAEEHINIPSSRLFLLQKKRAIHCIWHNANKCKWFNYFNIFTLCLMKAVVHEWTWT